MSIRVTLLLALILSNLSGCIIIRPKAETILTVHPDSTETGGREVGIKYVNWYDEEGKTVLVGYGVHYREHETYAFILNEPFPPYQPRWVVIEEYEDDQYILKLWLDYSLMPSGVDARPETETNLLHYQVNIESPKHTWLGHKTIILNNTKLSSPNNSQSIWITGRIKAKRSKKETLNRWRHMLESDLKANTADQ